MMILLLSFAAAAVSAAELPAPPAPGGEARRVIDRQLASPPRQGPAAGLSAAEADAVVARYIASIGSRVERDAPPDRKTAR